jgi:hypothetical protein
MMKIKLALPLHNLLQYIIERQLDAVEKKKKEPAQPGESLVYMIDVFLCFGVAKQGFKKIACPSLLFTGHHRFKFCLKRVI